MSDDRFSVIVTATRTTHDEILDAIDALGNAECTDASFCGHADGMELLFERGGESLQRATTSAIGEVERVGYRVRKVELEREAILV